MKYLIRILPLVVCVAGVWIIVSTVRKHQETQEAVVLKEAKVPTAIVPDAETYEPKDRELVQQVFEEPERFDSALPKTVSVAVASRPEGTIFMPDLAVNMIEKPRDPRTISMSSEEIDSFTSLRTDAVRNPESEQNQATVRTLMKMRQRRVSWLKERGGL